MIWDEILIRRNLKGCTTGKFMLNLARFTCPKRSTQIFMLIGYMLNILENNTHYVKINIKINIKNITL